MDPLDRFEPRVVIVDFVLRYIDKGPVTSNYYLGRHEEDGDNSDNGHHVIEFTEDGIDLKQ